MSCTRYLSLSGLLRVLQQLKPATEQIVNRAGFLHAIKSVAQRDPKVVSDLLQACTTAEQLRPNDYYEVLRCCLATGRMPSTLLQTMEASVRMEELATESVACLLHLAVQCRDATTVARLVCLPAATEITQVDVHHMLGMLCSARREFVPGVGPLDCNEVFSSVLSLPAAQDIPRNALWQLFQAAIQAGHPAYVLRLQAELVDAAELYYELGPAHLGMLISAAVAAAVPYGDPDDDEDLRHRMNFKEASTLLELLEHPQAAHLAAAEVEQFAQAAVDWLWFTEDEDESFSLKLTRRLQGLPAALQLSSESLTIILRAVLKCRLHWSAYDGCDSRMSMYYSQPDCTLMGPGHDPDPDHFIATWSASLPPPPAAVDWFRASAAAATIIHQEAV